MNVAIRLDYPPSVNTYYRRAGNTMYLSAKGRAFKESVAEDWKRLAYPPTRERIGVAITLHAPNKTQDTDIDNRVKATLDALQGLAYADDRQIDRLIVERGCVCKPGHCDVIVSEL